MTTDPFAILGISKTASVTEARVAYRRLAIRHHPDLNPGDVGAAERFKRVLRAYRAIASGAVRRAPAEQPMPAGPRPDRYACAGCGDSFPFPERCPRCDVILCDRSAGPPVMAVDPLVTELIRRLESRPSAPETAWEDRLPVPGLLVASCLLAAAFVWQVGPIGPALLFVGFAAYVLGMEMHRRAMLSFA
jgi:hypothetical protein